MKKIILTFCVLTLLSLYLGFLVKSKYFYAPYPNLIEYLLGCIILVVMLVLLIWKKNRWQKLWIGLGSVGSLFVGINILNYTLEWHPLTLSLPFSESQSFEVDYEPYKWQPASLEEAGLKADSVEAYLAGIENWKRLRALLVIKDDKLVLEKYVAGATPYSAFNVHSVTKSITSALVGKAIQQGRLPSEEERVMPFFQEFSGRPEGSRKDSLTLKHLLTMRGGFTGGDGYQTLAQCLAEEQIGPGFNKEFKYFTGSQHILSAILTKATGQTTKQYAEQELFKPLGMHQGFWRNLDGYYCGGAESYFTARDLARFGSLYLHHGKVGTQQVLDSAWVAKSLQNYSKGSKAFRKMGSYQEVGYGYCWWLLQDAKQREVFAARGKGGQHVLLIPSKNTIVVILQEWNLRKDPKTEEKFIHDLLALL